jgi:hypothetical protein
MEFIGQVHQLKTLNASTTLIVITMAYANTPHSKLVFKDKNKPASLLAYTPNVGD